MPIRSTNKARMIARNKKIKNTTKDIINSDRNGSQQSEGFFSKYLSFRSLVARRIYISFFTFALLAGMLSYQYQPNIGITLGEPSPRTLKANKTIEFEDIDKTEEDRNKNEAEVEDIYVYDIEKLNGEEGALYQVRYFYLLSGIVAKSDDKIFEEKVDYLTNLLGNTYEESIISEVLLLNPEERSELSRETEDIAREVMKEKITPAQLDFVLEGIPEMVDDTEGISLKDKDIAISVLQNNIQATAVFDPVATSEAREEARLNTPPHMVSIAEGQNIVFEGEIVNEDDILILNKLGLLEIEFSWTRYVYISFMTLAILVLFGFYIYRFNFKVFNNSRKLLLLAIFLVIFTALIKLLTTLSSVHLNLWNYLFPVIAASMLTTIIFDSRLGIIMTISLATFVGIAAEFDFNMALAYMIGGIFATYLVSNVSQRLQVMRAGFISSLILGFLFLATNLIAGEPSSLALYTILGVLNGIVCAILTIGILPFVESSFNIVTAMGLLELSHTDQPLLKRMLIEAPGTYNHSLLVGHLAENSAKAIGADSLLVKVAALYHDLGKLKRPEYFYENQSNLENVHDKLNPSMSKNVIASHVKDGIEVAIKNKIPRRVISIIAQHHGSSLLSYFYEKQKDKSMITTMDVDIQNLKGHFRYQARKPQSKEAAILMLADSAEAATRSIEDMTPKKIEQMVDYIIDNKIKDGQLDESDITLREISIIKKTLLEGLISIYHSRISYPDSNSKVEEKK